ncbi:MAG: ABC transporter substrate-binding protein [Sarcina sp.]
MKGKKIFSLLILTCLSFSVIACGGKDEGVSTGEKGKILYSNGGPVEFFETPWLNPGSFTSSKVLYDQLIEADKNLQPKEGELAKEYKLSEDGKELVFVLKDNIFWHDGDAITAKDIKWSIEYSLKTPVLNAVFMNTFKAIKGAKDYMDAKADDISGIVLDGNKITITFEDIAPDALVTFSQFSPLPEKHFKDVDPIKFQQAKYFQHPIGSGPFKVQEVKMNDYTTLAAFDKYHDGVAEFSIHLTPSPGDSDTNLVNNAKSGMLDYAYTKNIADVKVLQETDGLKVEQVDVRYTRLFFANKFNKKDGGKSPLADAKVRQALRYAIDMKTISESLFNGAAIPANSLTPNGADKVEGLENYDFNPEKAKELLKEANWDSNYELDVVYYYTDQLTVDFMTSIQAYLKDVGVKMKFRLVEGDLASLLWQAPSDQKNGPSAVDWDLAYGATSALSMHEYYDRYREGSMSNSHTPAKDELNTLIDATNNSVDSQEQKDAFFDLQKYENEELFAIPLYYQPVFIIQSDDIEGFTEYGNPQFHYDWDIQNWKIK